MAPEPAFYDADYVAWISEQSRLLRSGRLTEIDSEHLAEEIEDLGRHCRLDLENRLTVLTANLLKWQYCRLFQEHDGNAWRRVIRQQRRMIARRLRESPSLQRFAAGIFAEIYADARLDAADEADVPPGAFPATPPFTLQQALDPAFPADLWPEDWETAAAEH